MSAVNIKYTKVKKNLTFTLHLNHHFKDYFPVKLLNPQKGFEEIPPLLSDQCGVLLMASDLKPDFEFSGPCSFLGV